MTVIHTSRLELRRFSASDGEDLYEYLSDPQVVRFEPYTVFTREQSHREAARRAGDPSFWAVCLKAGGKLVGNVYLNYITPLELFTWELGFVFNARYQKQGYGLESCTALMQHAFDQQGARRIIALCNPENRSSWRLMERLGMRREGYMRQNIYFHCGEDGQPLWQDTYQYAILAQEWQKRNAKQP